MCELHSVAITKFITKSYKILFFKTDADINASIIAESINTRDGTINCDTMSQCD